MVWVLQACCQDQLNPSPSLQPSRREPSRGCGTLHDQVRPVTAVQLDHASRRVTRAQAGPGAVQHILHFLRRCLQGCTGASPLDVLLVTEITHYLILVCLGLFCWEEGERKRAPVWTRNSLGCSMETGGGGGGQMDQSNYLLLAIK